MDLRSIFEIEKAFQYTKWISITTLVVTLLVCSYSIYAIKKSNELVHKYIYVSLNDKLIEAERSNDEESIQALAHVNYFHLLFFRLEPNNQQIERNINQALNLVNKSGFEMYNQLNEAGFYKNLVRGNISMDIQKDTVYFSTENQNTIIFKGKQKIIRPSSVTFRSLITSAYIRKVESTYNNPFGFIMEQLYVIENEDISSIER